MRFLPLKWYHRKSFKYTMTSRKREVVIYRKATERHHEMKTNNNPIDENTKDRQESGSALSSRQRVILDALLREYEVALMLDLANDSYEIFKLAERFARTLSGLLKDRFSATMLDIADNCIYSYDYDLFVGAVSLESLRSRFEKEDFSSFVFRSITSRGPEYFRMRMIKAKEGPKAFIGVSCIQDEMSRELQQRRLFEGALDRARSADSAKSTFLTNMSHDIRTPMNAIIGFTNIASAHIDDKERVEDALEKIRTSSDHLLSLINNVLDMSRIESGRITIDEKKRNLITIVNKIQNILQPQIINKNLTFTIDTENLTVPEVYCDETRVTQILINLLSNAVKYTNPGGKVSLSIRQKSAGVGRRYCGYEFRVTDNGIGISKEFINRIFEPFEREIGRTENNSFGSGLGMSIAKGIIDMMGGTIRVESEENVGTQFVVDLEFRPARETETAAETEAGELRGFDEDTDEDMAVFREGDASSGKAKAEVGWIEGRRLLLVEDNPLNREIAEEMLVEDGFKVEVAENGRIAVQMIMNADPWYYSAVLMDIQMPVMDGYEATERIRSLSDRSRARIPVIAMTANAFNEDRRKAAECGMDAYITKPVDVLTLRYVLRRVLR